MEEIVDLSKYDVTQKPREGQIRRDEVQWTAMSISFKQYTRAQARRWSEAIKARVQCSQELNTADESSR